ncbi:sugar phosphate isomerase/epimerase family protein [Oryzibacter oryziterrae]|uniref:sugar phosphate isomerase/epimerase family protein n=1 Tax=Oryzibacter oryziterrae TaxID=2766474 RepID=UPI001F2423FD|nr:sugar phosphate isomerase/epimerase [Oryzibacter oryziterrae]
MKIATAPDAWGVWYASDPRQVSWERYLDEVRDAGYSATETGPYGYLPTDPAKLLDELGSRGLSVSGTGIVHPLSTADGLSTLLPRVRQTAELLKATGGGWILLMDDSDLYPLGKGRELAGAEWSRLVEATRAAAKLTVEEYGLGFVFHPHVGTGVETEPEIIRLLEETDEKLVGLCFDFGHHAYSGYDPVAFMKRYASRIPYYHFKNLDGAMRKKIADEKIDFVQGFQMGVMCELDKGVVDFAEVTDFLRASGYDGYVVVEQDMYPCPPEKPFPIAKHNREVLRRLGL